MAGSSSPRPDDNDRLRLPVTSSPRTRGAEKKESTDLRLSQPCPPYVTPSSISSFGRRLDGVHTAENKSLKNTGANRFCQSSARLQTQLAHQVMKSGDANGRFEVACQLVVSGSDAAPILESTEHAFDEVP